jgi:hypothetical protein
MRDQVKTLLDRNAHRPPKRDRARRLAGTRRPKARHVIDAIADEATTRLSGARQA